MPHSVRMANACVLASHMSDNGCGQLRGGGRQSADGDLGELLPQHIFVIDALALELLQLIRRHLHVRAFS